MRFEDELEEIKKKIKELESNVVVRGSFTQYDYDKLDYSFFYNFEYNHTDWILSQILNELKNIHETLKKKDD